MNIIEIVMQDIQKKYINRMMESSLEFKNSDIISSHFFDKDLNEEIKYQKINNFEEYFCNSGTCNLFLEKMVIGVELKKVLILISCTEELLDISITFSEDQFMDFDSSKMHEYMQGIICALLEIQKEYYVDSIFLGYEPAIDSDMRILEFNKKGVKAYNERVFQSLFAQSLYNVIKNE